MAVKAFEKYEGTIQSAILSEIPTTHTLYLGISVLTSDGPVIGKFWVTPNTIARLSENIEKLGVPTEALSTNGGAFWDEPNKFLKGKPCNVETEEQTDTNGNVLKDKNENPYIQIKWINPSRLGKPVPGSRVSALFGGSGGGSQEPPPNDFGGIEDEPTPF